MPQIASSAFIAKVAILMLAAKECADEHEDLAGPNRCSQSLRVRLIETDRFMVEAGLPSMLDQMSRVERVGR